MLNKFFISLFFLISVSFLSTRPIRAQEGDWGFGVDLGVLTGTVEGGQFAIGLGLDRYVHRVASIGLQGFVTPSSDLFSVSGAGVLRFHIELTKATVSPFVGVGAIFEDVEREENNVMIKDDDTSYYVPIGIAIEHPFNENLTGGIKIILNLHDLEFKKPIGDDTRSAYITGTLNFLP